MAEHEGVKPEVVKKAEKEIKGHAGELVAAGVLKITDVGENGCVVYEVTGQAVRDYLKSLGYSVE